MRITSWILSFTSNCRNYQHQFTGPQSTEEIQAPVNLWIVQIQKEMLQDPQYKQYEEQLNLVKDQQGIFVYKGRIQGFNSIFFPRNSIFTE